ncbi:MAG: hypothetical protein WCG25_10205 [bacterium]
MENENKQYFTPDITDIKVGYECEVNPSSLAGGKDYWVNNIAKSIINLQGLEELLKVDCLRTPYLTKEQIENEGWKEERENYYYKEDAQLHTFIGKIDNKIFDMRISIYNDIGKLFYGECKDINTFRWICKLLKIN